MSDFKEKTAPTLVVPPDPTKHVNYTQGMVLGVDDFTQEFDYLSGREEWLTRELLGYGTVCGLKVAIEKDGVQGPQVAISAGTAVSPRGQLISVPNAQCAAVDDWLKARKSDLDRVLSSSSTSVTLYVVLCYRSCPTDPVPIPGEPCRSEDESMAPSRLRDDFKLELRAEIPGQPGKPDQREEDALRDYLAWLKQIDIDDTQASTPLLDFLHAIRDAMQPWAFPPVSPPSSPPGDFMWGSPPVTLHVNSADLGEYFRAASLLWVTELRPLWLGKNQTCDTPPDEGCLLLAELSVPLVNELSGERRVDSSADITVHEERRPYVLPLRVLQEWMLSIRSDGKVVGLLPVVGGYTIVAAGIIVANGILQPNVYNELTAKATADSELLVTFNGYRDPAVGEQYIAKVMPVHGGTLSAVVVNFLEFNGGMKFRVTDAGVTIAQGVLAGMQFMIEVSQYKV